MKTDYLTVGDLYTLDYLRTYGLINSPTVGKLFSFSPVPYVDNSLVKLENKLSKDDDSPVYVVKENNVVARSNYEYLIDKGTCFYVENVYTLASEATAYIVVDSENIEKQFSSFPTAWKTSSGPVLITLGTCVSYSGGDEITPLNRNSKAGISAEVGYIYNPTLTGEIFPDYPTILVGTESTNQNSGGADIAGRLPILLNGYNYVFKIENMSGNEIYLYSDIIWFEV